LSQAFETKNGNKKSYRPDLTKTKILFETKKAETKKALLFLFQLFLFQLFLFPFFVSNLRPDLTKT